MRNASKKKLHPEIKKTEFESEMTFCPYGQILQDEPDTGDIMVVLQSKCGRCKTTDKISCELSCP